MNRQISWLLNVYTYLMKLYPTHYRSEFGEDRQEVFSLALQEAADRGKRALFHLVLYELHDFPASVIRANVREWEAIMKSIETKLGEEPLSWIGLLFGAWPFIFLGPVMAIAPYLPGQASRLLRYDSPLWLTTVFLSLLIGILVGWRKGFPGWVYPYLVILFFAIAIPLLGKLSLLVGPNRFSPWIATAILLVSILGLGAAILFLLSRIPPTRKILHDIRADWTRLSFGMVVFLAFGTSFYGGDHLPPFGLGIWLPSVFVVLGAIAYLLCHSLRMRSLVLIATLLVSFLGRLIFPYDDTWSIWPILLLVLLIFLPALVGLFPLHNIRQVNDK